MNRPDRILISCLPSTTRQGCLAENSSVRKSSLRWSEESAPEKGQDVAKALQFGPSYFLPSFKSSPKD